MAKKEKVVFCTGLTEQEFVNELKQQKKGKHTPPRCYICKRKAGEKAISVIDGADKLAMPKLRFDDWVSVIEDDDRIMKFKFRICQECMLLLRSLGEHKYYNVKIDPNDYFPKR